MVAENENLTEKQTTMVYNETTKPKKPKRRDKSDLGPDFVAPDGGWGWVVCLAAGFTNFFMFPALQQYGLMYRERMLGLGFDAKQTTSIVNIAMAVSSLVGLVNGAMYRRFSFRQVAMTGSILVFLGVFASAFATTFIQYVIALSTVYGLGLGMTMGAVSLAVNTYFKNNRRRATGFSWTITGLGPIIFPYVTSVLLGYYGAQGTILLYAGVSLNAFLCALTLHPVQQHVKAPEKLQQNEPEIMRNGNGNGNGNENGIDKLTVSTPLNGGLSLTVAPNNSNILEQYECKYCQYQKYGKRNIFSSQYLFNADDVETPGYEITDPGTPMLARANDGWFGSKLSLASEKGSRYRHNLLRRTSYKSREAIVETGGKESSLYKPNYFNREREEIDRYISKTSVYSKPGFDEFRCTCAEEKMLLQQKSDEEIKLDLEKQKQDEEAEELAKSKMTFCQKVVKFFDLDLLKDITYVNLALGITMLIFADLNFSVLTPFILSSYNYTNNQISLAMSFLGGMDLIVRFLAPFALEKVKLDNRILCAFGMLIITIGRAAVTLTNSFEAILIVFIIIGFGKGLRTVFIPLILPSYVPLKRLPAATGLQLVFNSIFSLIFGPILGFVTDATSYTVTIHFINTMTLLALLFWLLEALARRILRKPSISMGDN